jgi:hypothetical protein
MLGVLSVVVSAVALSACGSSTLAKSPTTTGPVATTATTTPKTTTTAPTQVSANLYFVRGPNLGVAQRLVNAGADPHYLTVQALLAGPDATEIAAGLGTEIPAGTALRGLEIRGGVATINLSPQFITPGPPPSLAARLAQIVYTLTAYPNIGKVAIAVSKLPLTTFAGVNLSTPVGRSQVTAALPDVLLEAPAVGSTVHGASVYLSGLTSFVGTFDIQLLDATGKLLAATTNTAVPSSTFTQTLPVRASSPNTGSLRIYARPSAPGQPVQVTSFQLPIQ